MFLAFLIDSQFRWPMRLCQVAIGRTVTDDKEHVPRGFSTYIVTELRSAISCP